MNPEHFNARVGCRSIRAGSTSGAGVIRPKFVSTPLADGLKWRGSGGWRFEEKLDGVWSVREFQNATIVGELMRDGRFYAFDVVAFEGIDTRKEPLRNRIQILDSMPLLRPAVGVGGEFLEAVLKRGGEGVVAKDLDSRFGFGWFKCKRIETFDLVCAEKALGKSSIRLTTIEGEERGWCPCFSQYDNVRVGDIVEVAAFATHASGKLREPRFIRIRHDKV